MKYQPWLKEPAGYSRHFGYQQQLRPEDVVLVARDTWHDYLGYTLQTSCSLELVGWSVEDCKAYAESNSFLAPQSTGVAGWAPPDMVRPLRASATTFRAVLATENLTSFTFFLVLIYI